MFQRLLPFACLCLSGYVLFAQGLIIQENEIGFCSVDGIVEAGVEGYTGDGFANADIAAGTSALWNINATEAGSYRITWRYANGGGAGDLVAELWVNEEPVIADYTFTHTGSWRTWTESDTVAVDLQAGENKIRLVSVSPSGLTNIDYFQVLDEGVTAAPCLPSYYLRLSQNDDAGGTITYEPEQAYYDEGTEITLRATANLGYFFQSWSGDETSAEREHTFQIQRNAEVEALFFSEGTTAADGVIGYATVQDDAGTPYLMTGGLGGDTVLATNFATLRNYLESERPYVVTVADHLVATGQVNVKSNKTLLGITEEAHLEGIRIKINGATNVIFRNITLSKVVRYDALEINNSRNIWIHECEFFSDLDNGSEYYDGLLDIKNAASYITVSNTEFHDHFKAVLISSGDDSVQDTVIRITFHHNYFHNLGSRTPLLRFGKAHIFNNYFRSCSSGINSRMGACMRVENNFFFQVNRATRTDMSAEVGAFQLIDNIFAQSNYVTEPTCELEVPYDYALDAPEEVPMLVANEPNPLGVREQQWLNLALVAYPNPARGEVTLRFELKEATAARLRLYDARGQQIRTLADQHFLAGLNQISFSVLSLPPGLYLLQFRSPEGVATQRLLVQ